MPDIWAMLIKISELFILIKLIISDLIALKKLGEIFLRAKI